MVFKFCVLRKINSWLVKVTFYDNLDTLFIDTCKHMTQLHQHRRDTASVTVTDVTVTVTPAEL